MLILPAAALPCAQVLARRRAAADPTARARRQAPSPHSRTKSAAPVACDRAAPRARPPIRHRRARDRAGRRRGSAAPPRSWHLALRKGAFRGLEHIGNLALAADREARHQLAIVRATPR